MSTYYGEVLTKDDVRSMFDRVMATAERGVCHEWLPGPEMNLRLMEVAAVRELCSALLDSLNVDEIKSPWPAGELAKLRVASAIEGVDSDGEND